MKQPILNISLCLLTACLPLSLAGATNTWIGGNGDWEVPTNWSTGSVPGTGDLVVIGSGPSITVTHSSNDTEVVLSVQCQQTLDLFAGSITVTSNASQLSGSLMMSNGATLGASGAGTTFTCSGAINAYDGSFSVAGGAVMSLPTLTSYAKNCSGGYWTVTGAGSELNLPALTNMTGAACNFPTVEAEAGGQILATNLTSIVMGPETFQADGSKSLIDLRGLKTCAGQQGYPVVFEASAGGTVRITNLASANLVTLNFTGVTNNFPVLTNFPDGNLNLSGAAQVTMPVLRQYTKTCYGANWDVTGTNSLLSLPGLTNINGQACSYPTIEAENGGQILATNLTTIAAGPLTFQTDGPGSVMGLNALTACSGQGSYYVTFEASTGGSMQISNLQGGDLLALSLIGVTMNLPVFSNFPDGNITLAGGAVLTLPALQIYTKTCYGAYWSVTGTNTTLNLPGLTNINANACNYPTIEAESGGQILATNLTSMLASPLTFQADGAGSLINFINLTNCVNQSSYLITFEASAGGMVEIPHLTNGSGVLVSLNPGGSIPVGQLQSLAGMAVDGVTVSFTALSNFFDANLTIGGGAVVTLPALRIYTKDCSGGNWTVTGSNSVLNLPELTNMTGAACQYPIIQAEAGGQILFTNLHSILLGPQTFQADGSNSWIYLTALTNCNGQSNYDVAFEASAGGEIVLTNLPEGQLLTFTYNAGGSIPITRFTNLFDGQITASSNSVSLPALLSVDWSSLTVNDSGSLLLSNVGNYSGGTNGGTPVWEATGTNSTLSLTGLTNLVGNSNPGYPMQINAMSGGQVLLNNLQTIDDGYMAFLSEGTNSVIDLTNLSGFVLLTGQGSLTATNGGTILFNSQAFLLANVAISIPTGNPFLPSTLIPSSSLTLYGQPWNSYTVEQRNLSIPNSQFTFFERVPLTNTFEVIAPQPPPNTEYIVSELVAVPPILDASLDVSNQIQLVLYGLTNGSYEIQGTTNMSPSITWTNYTSVTMTNAFRFLPPIPPTQLKQFYRAMLQ